MKTKLEQIINIGIEKGFDCFGWIKKHKDYELEVISNSLIKFKYNIVKKPYGVGNFEDDTFRMVPEGHSYYIFSLNDLLFSPGSNLMQALFGEVDKWYTTKCTCGGLDFHVHGPDIHKKECAKVKANRGGLFHQQQLLPLNDQERILYIANALGVE